MAPVPTQANATKLCQQVERVESFLLNDLESENHWQYIKYNYNGRCGHYALTITLVGALRLVYLAITNIFKSLQPCCYWKFKLKVNVLRYWRCSGVFDTEKTLPCTPVNSNFFFLFQRIWIWTLKFTITGYLKHRRISIIN